MLRYSLVLCVGLCTAGPALSSSWTDSMFAELSRDFGSVPRGPTLTHLFRLTNNTGTPVTIGHIRVSCGCVTATPLKHTLQPGEESGIMVQMDTRRFAGVKTVTLYVQFIQPRREEVRLWLAANSRDDVTVAPDTLAFGQTKRGTTATAVVTITFLGNGSARILTMHSDSNYIQPTLRELRREENEVMYQLTARLRPDAPVGKWYTDIWLQTNTPSMPRVRVPLTVEIESSLSVSPAVVLLGQMHVGGESERKLMVRGVRPFRITTVLGTDGQVTVRDSTTESKTVHVLTVTLRPSRPGDFLRTFRVITDMPEEGEIEFHARAQVAP